jgi:hypothetical protein
MTSQNAVHGDPVAVVTGGNRGIGLELCRLWGVTLPDDGLTGGFFQDSAPLPW